MGLVTDVVTNEILLSLETLKRLGVVPEDYPRSQWSKARKATSEDDVDLAKEVEKLKEKYPEVFDHEVELKIMNGDSVKIELKNDVPIKPLHINVPRRVPYAEEAAAKA